MEFSCIRYTSFGVWTLPGVALLFNSWLALTTVLVGIAAVKLFVKEETEAIRQVLQEARKPA